MEDIIYYDNEEYMIKEINQLFNKMHQSNFQIKEFEIFPPYCDVPDSIAGISIPQFIRNIYKNHIGSISAVYKRNLNKNECNAFGETLGVNCIYGGPVLYGADKLEKTRQLSEEWARQTWISEDIVQTTIWLSSIPFIGMDNGDYVAFNGNGQIVYLNHDDESFVIADTFSDFWSIWESIYFISPEWWMLKPFLTKSGMLDGDSKNISKFRAAFEGKLLKGA